MDFGDQLLLSSKYLCKPQHWHALFKDQNQNSREGCSIKGRRERGNLQLFGFEHYRLCFTEISSMIHKPLTQECITLK